MTHISKIILGTVQLGMDYGINNSNGKPNKTEAYGILADAANQGVSCLDTAAGYGSSEEVIGEFFKKQDHIPFEVITKLSTMVGSEWRESLGQSLHRLQVDSLDTIMFHSFQHYRENESRLDELQTYIDKGLIKKIGVSVYTNEELMRLTKAPKIQVVQAPFNLLDNSRRRAAPFEALKAAGKEIHIRSVFLQGLFFKKFDTFPAILRELKSPLTELDLLCQQNGVSKAELALCYPLSKEYIDKVLIGVDSRYQLETNLAILKKPISSSVLAEVDEQIDVLNTELLNPSNWKK